MSNRSIMLTDSLYEYLTDVSLRESPLLLALREEDYTTAARLMGAKPSRIISRHLLPGFMSHLIAAATLS